MTTDEFEQLSGKLGELEDYLRDQGRLARAVGRTADGPRLRPRSSWLSRCMRWRNSCASPRTSGRPSMWMLDHRSKW
jgi:hypothetical protein